MKKLIISDPTRVSVHFLSEETPIIFTSLPLSESSLFKDCGISELALLQITEDTLEEADAIEADIVRYLDCYWLVVAPDEIDEFAYLCV